MEKSANKVRATDADRQAATEAHDNLRPVLDELARLDAVLVPYEQTKTELSEARSRYRALTKAFAGELRNRCAALTEQEKRTLVLELFAQDVQTGLDGAVGEKRQVSVRLLEGLWDKYRVPLTVLRDARNAVESRLHDLLGTLAYS